MGLYSVETEIGPEEAIERAIAYFGKGGLGLELTDQKPCCVYFEGGGGHISVIVTMGEKKTTVQLETREWDYHVKRFMQKVG